MQDRKEIYKKRLFTVCSAQHINYTFVKNERAIFHRPLTAAEPLARSMKRASDPALWSQSVSERARHSYTTLNRGPTLSIRRLLPPYPPPHPPPPTHTHPSPSVPTSSPPFHKNWGDQGVLCVTTPLHYPTLLQLGCGQFPCLRSIVVFALGCSRLSEFSLR